MREPKERGLTSSEVKALIRFYGKNLEDIGIQHGRVWEDAEGGLWVRLPKWLSFFHGVSKGNKKYVGLGDNAGREAVYRKDGTLETNSAFAGSANRVDPLEDPIGHFEKDVLGSD